MKDQDPTPQALKAAQDIAGRYLPDLTIGTILGNHVARTMAHVIDQHCQLHQLQAVVEAARAVLREDRGPEPPVYLNRRLNALGEALDALPGPQNPSDRTKPPPEA